MTRDDVFDLAKKAGISELMWWDHGDVLERFAALVAAASKREWVGLTDDEFNDCFVKGDPCENLADPEAWAVMKQVEAKLREKNT